jgi:DNA-binding MarR family transcriptional regulator
MKGQEANQQIIEGEPRHAPPAESIGYLLRRAHRSFNKVLQSRLRAENITIGMWHYLRELWEEDGIDQRDLSRRTSNLETSVVSAMALLEKHGLVWREQDSKDRRRKFVHLTSRGRALQYSLRPHAQETNRIALQGLDKEAEETLGTLLRQITDNLERHIQKS